MITHYTASTQHKCKHKVHSGGGWRWGWGRGVTGLSTSLADCKKYAQPSEKSTDTHTYIHSYTQTHTYGFIVRTVCIQ